MRIRTGSLRRLALLAAFATCRGQEPARSPQLAALPGDPSTTTATFGTTVVIPSGLRGDIYHLRRNTWVLPDFANLEPVGSIWTTTLNISPRHWKDGFPGVTRRNEWFGIVYTGRFWVEKPGRYQFALMSDDGSKLFIDDVMVVDNDCQHPPLVRTSAVTLSGGAHRIRVLYFQGPRDCIALTLAVAGPDDQWRIFSTEEFKPPSNPEEWKFGDPADLKEPLDPDANRRRLGDGLRKPRKVATTPPQPSTPPHSSAGCIVPDAVPRCYQ